MGRMLFIDNFVCNFLSKFAYDNYDSETKQLKKQLPIKFACDLAKETWDRYSIENQIIEEKKKSIFKV